MLFGPLVKQFKFGKCQEIISACEVLPPTGLEKTLFCEVIGQHQELRYKLLL